MSAQEQFSCPYCDAELSPGVLSCRCCGRDLTPVLPLLRRLDAVEGRLATIQAALDEANRLAAEASAAAPLLPSPMPMAFAEPEQVAAITGTPLSTAPRSRRFWVLPLGLVVILAAYLTVVLWLDLPLYALRSAAMAIPFAIGISYYAARPRLRWFDTAIVIFFAISTVAAMNALLGWIDNIPVMPQGTAAWRESFFYALTIGASMFSGMLVRVTLAALATRGLTSIPRLREGLLSVNGKMPMDTIKAIELSILMISTVVSAIAGLVAVLLGVK